MTITLTSAHLSLEFGTAGGAPVRLASYRYGAEVSVPFEAPLVEVLVLGAGRNTNQTRNLVNTTAGAGLRYHSHEVDGLRLTLRQVWAEGGLEACTIVELCPDAAAARFSTSVTNLGDEELIVEALTPAVLPVPFQVAESELLTGMSSWCAENRWLRQTLPEAGLADDNSSRMPVLASASVVRSGTSTWTTDGGLPVGVLEHRPTGSAWAWQVEHNGPWRWELDAATTVPDRCLLAASGPTELDHQAGFRLAPGQSLDGAGLSVAFSRAGWQDAMAQLTRHRRTLALPHTSESGRTGLVFNDYMNTINADPSWTKLRPLIDAAARVGAEYFCIDAGWYDESGHWWGSVGEWKPSDTRFGEVGLQGVLDHIVARGMVPGLWLEPEVIGVDSPMARTLPAEAFLTRNGRRVVEFSRYFLDLGSPAARHHLDQTFDRLIAMGAGFFKLDYNVTPGGGADADGLTRGAGLARHCQGYLEWFEALRARHLGVLFENCASGAMRQDWAQVSRFDLQSTSDQQDFLLYPPIAAGAPMMLLPEQCGNWAYAQPTMTLEEIAFVHVTGLSGRSYFSGYVDRMSPEQFALVEEAARTWKSIRGQRAASVPYWPGGLPGWADNLLSVAFVGEGHVDLAVWNRGAATQATLELPPGTGGGLLQTLYPTRLGGWEAELAGDRLSLRIPAGPTARLIRIATAGIAAS